MSVDIKKILEKDEKHLQIFLQFVGMAPNAQEALLLIYNNQNSRPQKLFNSYQSLIKNQVLLNDIFCTVKQINGKNTVIYGLNNTFFNLNDDNQQLTCRHLILLYLLRKYSSIKFCFCYDKDAITNNSFRDVIKSFERLAFAINYEQIKSSQSFMVLLYHGSNESIIDTTKDSLKKLIKQKLFGKIQAFAQSIQQSTVKNGMIMEINRDLQSNKINEKKTQFEQMISKLNPVKFQQNNQKVMLISNLYLNTLSHKSADWKIFKTKQNLKKSQLNNTQSTNKSKKLQSQFSCLFSIWENIFQKFIDFIIKKLKNPKQAIFTKFAEQVKFLPSYQCEKYKIPSDLFGSIELRKANSSDIIKVFSRVANSIVKIITENQKNNLKQGEKIQFCNKSLLNFIQLFYQCKILSDSDKDKTLFDSFMVFNELYDTLYSIRNLENPNSSFFQVYNFMTEYLSDQPKITKQFLSNISNIFIHQLQMDLNEVKKGQPIALERLSLPLQKITKHLDEKQEKENKFAQMVPKIRILSTIKQFQIALFEQKMKKISNNPHKQIQLILDYIKKEEKKSKDRKFQAFLGIKKDFLIQLVKSFLKYIEQNNTKDIPIDFKNKLINVLSTEIKETKFVIKIYEKEFESIIRKKLKFHQNLSNNESQFIQSFIEYLIKTSNVQKAKSIAHLVSQIDEAFSRCILIRCLQKTNHKRQLQFLKTQISPQNKRSLHEQFINIIKQNEKFREKIQTEVKKQIKQNQDLIEI